MTPNFWHRVSLIADRNRHKLMKAANWGMLFCGLVFGSLALAFWSFKLMFLGLWLIIVQLFWCIGLYILIANYKRLPAPHNPGLVAGWTRVMLWYGAIFNTIWLGGLILATFVAPLLIAFSSAS